MCLSFLNLKDAGSFIYDINCGKNYMFTRNCNFVEPRKPYTNPNHFGHDVMDCRLDDEDLLSSICKMHIISMLLPQENGLKANGKALLPYNSATLSSALADPLLRRRNVLFLPTESV